MSLSSHEQVQREVAVSRVRVEFFGLARTRAGVEAVRVDAATLRDVLSELAVHFPTLDGLCFQDGQLSKSWLININGQQFTRELDTAVAEGDSLLLMSADAGG